MTQKNSTIYTPQDIYINNKIYQSFLNANLDDGWTHPDKIDNFDYLVKIEQFSHFPLKNCSVLDVGCGTGDLAGYLTDYNITDYAGIDIFHQGLTKAQSKYPDKKFILGDFLETNFSRQFDYVFCSGAMTTNLQSDNYQIIRKWIPKMWHLSKKGAAFNFLIEQFEGHFFGSLYLYNPDKVLEIIKQEIPSAKLQTIITPAGAGDTLDEMHVYLY